MMLKRYGVLKAKPIGIVITKASTHLEIHAVDEEKHYRISINVKSETVPPELRYIIFDDFKHPIIDKLGALPNGFNISESIPEGVSLDYIRGNLFDYHDMKIANHIVGPDNELSEAIKLFIDKAIRTQDAEIYAFGRYWGPEDRRDKFFGFKPGAGIHDIHMNQGNSGKWIEDNAVWQDGGMFINFPRAGRWVAVFLAFQAQIFHTDDITGKPIIVTRELEENIVVISSALLNPKSGHQTVTLKNTSSKNIDLSGWSLADDLMNKYKLRGKIKKGSSLTVAIVTKVLEFPRTGGILTLLDKNSLKVSGVTYTAKDYKEKGKIISFK